MEQHNSTDIAQIMQLSKTAFEQYRKVPALQRAAFLQAIAEGIEQSREILVQTAGEETNLPAARLNGEIGRTIGQLKQFANLITEGSWLEATIDTADSERVPPKPDTRSMMVPIGPVVVFGASNFPFAYSTAGGDTASALAAGSSVVVKGHSAHAKTSTIVFGAIKKAIVQTNMPANTVQHVLGAGNTVGKGLVMHPFTTGVGFTGSYTGGTALVDYSHQRETPIPVFAEMSSINPVVLLPGALTGNAETLAQQLAGSITLGVGQFCTNPGLLISLKSKELDNFLQLLGHAMQKAIPQKMLHKGIHESYNSGLEKILAQKNVTLIARSSQNAATMEGTPSLAKVSSATFLQNPHLHEEVFGPFSLMIECADKAEMTAVLQSLRGQLTATIMGTSNDFNQHKDIIDLQKDLAGRIILNGVPTGVEVCPSMVHGGPYPATTDGRFTSVGTKAIKRWVRPVCFQSFSDELLPEELKNSNPLNIWRLVNNSFTKEVVKPAQIAVLANT
jgi:NADP-dependent aldehyde dehydrogenase